MKKKQIKKEIVIYQAKSGAIELWGDFNRETIWASQAEIAKIFDVTSQNITLHLGSIFKEKELDAGSTCKESLQVQKEGGREIKRKIKVYNLDVIIAVGYRINSVLGTEFRKWATKTLRMHIVDGYTINRPRIAKNYEAFLKAVEQVKNLLPAGGEVDAKSTLELVKLFADTWFSLNAYDNSSLPSNGATKKQVKLTATDLTYPFAFEEIKSPSFRRG